MKRILTIASIAIVAAACQSTAHSKSGTISNNSGNHPASNDVSITSCAPSDTGFSAGVSVTNNTSKTSNYLVTVAFDSADGKTQYDTGIAALNNVQPGQTASDTADSFKTIPGGAVCRVAEVSRYAS